MSEVQQSRTIPELVRQWARERPNEVALNHRDRVTSYGVLDQRISQVANGLADLGVKRHDRVGYLGKNSDLYFELLFGTTRAGAALVPVNSRLAIPEISAILGDAGVTILFLGPGYGEVPTSLNLPNELRCVSLDGASANWPDFVAWRDAQSTADPRVETDAEDTAFQLYTSGTTGLPKGVELSHRNYLAVLASAVQGGYADLVPDDVLLVCMPVFHAAGTLLGLFGLVHGAKVIVMEEFNSAELATLIARHSVTWLLLVPAAILALLQHPAAATSDFSSIRTLIYGASPIAEALIAQARATFSNAKLYQLYGLTEATGGGTILPPEAHDPARGKLRSCGLPYPGFELKIVDPIGEPVPVGEVGEIVLRSAAVMKGYWNNPAATAASFFPGGWLRTGDAAYMDEEGYIYIYDRIKDMIVSGGENVYPAEVENALFGHPAIADVAVIGVPDARWGEVVKAIVVLRQGQTATADEILSYGRLRIAGYKLPKSIDFTQSLPRNPTGKVLRRLLRAPYWEGRDRQVS
jgi:fatty-acyl-CoA synthase